MSIANSKPDGNRPILRVALCQVYTEQWNVAANLERTLAALDEAARQGAELAITPECVLHGYGFDGVDDYRARMLEVAERLDGPNVTRLCAKVKSLKMDTVVGIAERGDGDQVHNAALFIHRDGTIRDVYRKVHCRPFEHADHQGVFSPGERFNVLDVRHGERVFRVGVMICFDREIPESVRCLRALGAELVVCPLATDTSDLSRLPVRMNNEVITQCRAAENEVFIVVVNHAGRFNGGSFAVGPLGETIHQMGPEPGVQVLDLPVNTASTQYHADPLGWMGWGYRRSAVYAKYLG
jgi:predicted amidohydrolase